MEIRQVNAGVRRESLNEELGESGRVQGGLGGRLQLVRDLLHGRLEGRILQGLKAVAKQKISFGESDSIANEVMVGQGRTKCAYDLWVAFFEKRAIANEPRMVHRRNALDLGCRGQTLVEGFNSEE